MWSPDRKGRALAALVAAGALAGPLGACGFHPLYRHAAPGQAEEAGTADPAELAAIYVDTIPNRLGQELRNQLLTLLDPTGSPANPRYLLRTSLATSTQNMGIRHDSTATRVDVNIAANVWLFDAATRKPLFHSVVQFTDGYNLVDNAPFANFSARQNLESRGTEILAQEIRTRLAVFFAQGQPRSRALEE